MFNNQLTENHHLSLGYYLHKKTKDIYKGIRFGDLVTGYIKYKKVDYKTERKNKEGYYLPYQYPFESYEKSKTREAKYFDPLGLYLPHFKIEELCYIPQTKTLAERWDDESIQLNTVRKMFHLFKKEITRFEIKKMGFDASLQCRLETPSSDIDLVVKDADLYTKLHELISNHHEFELFSSKVVDRRGAYSSFSSTNELIAFENRKISFLFKEIKVSILFTEKIEIGEHLNTTGSFIFIKSKPCLDKSIGEPSLVKLSNVEVIYGPTLSTKKDVFYLSVLPTRTGFLLKKEDTLFITGVIYTGRKTGNIYISQFPWDYCKIFKNHNIALNTYIQQDDTDKRIVGHFFENIKI
jgi:hypothetical protein